MTLAVLPGVVDSHCHLQSLAADEREAALDRARARGVAGFLVPATKLGEADTILALCERHSDVWCALGVHPHEASSWQGGDAARLAAILAHPKAVAVGECGLDFHYDFAPREQQERALREQWELALDLDLPVVVHNRESEDAMLALLAEPRFAALRADFHSFSGGAAMAKRLLARGNSWLGISGMVTFKKAENVREPLTFTPADRLLVETDTPYLAPVPYRGKPNEPAFVVDVALRLAQELGCEPARVAAQTTANVRDLFGIAITEPVA
ncbi:MAG TPA: TatD family hydrolase [Thermoanaerobaculia bacterium]|nr:TatD family hydrolase [Thermoanaerobaculia bacterium]